MTFDLAKNPLTERLKETAPAPLEVDAGAAAPAAPPNRKGPPRVLRPLAEEIFENALRDETDLCPGKSLFTLIHRV